MADLTLGAGDWATPDYATDRWPVAPGHELSDEDWAQVVAGVEASVSARGLLAPAQAAAYTDITYPGAGGRKDSGAATTQLRVIHTAECPLRAGYAVSLSRWSADSTVQASWNRMTDPATCARFVPVGRAAWHATIANRISIGYEQAGYAAFTRDIWLTPDGLASIDRLARAIVDDGIPAADVRLLTDAEVRRALGGDTSVRGICSHAQIQPKDRTDPGAGYPWDVLLDLIRHHHPDLQGGDDMPLTQDDLARIGFTVIEGTPLEGGGNLSSWVKAARLDAGQARQDAAAARALAETAAARGSGLTVEQVRQAVEAAIAAQVTVTGDLKVVPR